MTPPGLGISRFLPIKDSQENSVQLLPSYKAACFKFEGNCSSKDYVNNRIPKYADVL